MKLFITSDHNGVNLVDYLYNELKKEYDIERINIPNDPNDDYPIFSFELGKLVSKTPDSFGIILCGTGVGVSIACNKVKGIRCARVSNVNDAQMCRLHNNCNVIALGSNYTNNEALTLIKTFISTECLNEERHIRRIKQIIDYENGEYNEL